MDNLPVVEPSPYGDCSLKIRLGNNRRLTFSELAAMLGGLDELYGTFMARIYRERYSKADKSGSIPILQPRDTHLYIKEIREGSLVVEAVSSYLPYLQTLWENREIIVQFTGHIVEFLKFFRGEADRLPVGYEPKELPLVRQALLPAINQAGGISFSNYGDNSTFNIFNLPQNEAPSIGAKIDGYLAEQKTPSIAAHQKKLLRWNQARFDMEAQVGDRGVIEDFSIKPVKIIWEDHHDKAVVMTASINGKPWQDLAFVVDVNVQSIKGVPKLYNILRVYHDETFDPEE